MSSSENAPGDECAVAADRTLAQDGGAASASPSAPQTPPLPGIIGKAEILSHLAHGTLITDASPDSVQGCSYDMRIGTIFRGRERIKRDSPHPDKFVQIQPGEIVSILTLEELRLPNDIAAIAFAINLQSSRGLLVLNPGHVDPGFIGPLTVTALNLNKSPLSIELGRKIFTVVFERLPRATQLYSENRPRTDREHDLSQHIQTAASRNVGDLIVANAESPFVSQADLDRSIQELGIHSKDRLNSSLTYTGLCVAAGGLIVALASLVIAIIAMIVAIKAPPDREYPSLTFFRKVETLQLVDEVADR
jgi:deoxycytidine triphosphate deaminase